jgi:signal transduction histidine kinase
VLTNYLTNALKYSAADKPVEVHLLVEGHNARVAVRDEGPGLSLKEQQQVWQCFYQAQDVTVLSGSGVGLGLGLHISQTIVELHQGRVGVESVVGQGSTFWFTLPLAQQEERISGE